jgi:O-antigen/teichoic acid export membrane protein
LLALPLGNLLLVPAYGTLGAAAAAVISMTIWAVALWLTALKYTRLDVSVFPLMRGAFRS